MDPSKMQNQKVHSNLFHSQTGNKFYRMHEQPKNEKKFTLKCKAPSKSYAKTKSFLLSY
jgi:hypothetical protein